MDRTVCGRCGDWIGHGRSHYCLGPLTKSITDKPIITKATIQPCPGCAATNQVQLERIAELEADLATAQEDARVTSEELGVRLTERNEARAEAQALRADAERWRKFLHFPDPARFGLWVHDYGKEWAIAAIDAARSAMPGSAPTEE